MLPTVLLLVLTVWPLVRGDETLFMRDVLNTHLEMRAFQAEAMKEGYLPLVDPWRGGGQPHLGNPNTVALYPDNLLLLFASPIWALNAHFWIHWLLAPFAMYWMGRAWGLGRAAAWAAGVCFAASGFFVSELNLYNLVAGAALAPALVAAALSQQATRERPAKRLAPPALAKRLALPALWALLLLAGDPMSAAMALLLALAAAAVRFGWDRGVWIRLATGLGLGTLVAAPQLVEFLRILPLSFRGHWGYSAAAATAASFDPRSALEWLLPLAFGAPGLAFWGPGLYGGHPPLFYSLYPGVAALALVVVATRSRSRPAAWAWGAVAVGGFLALGRFNPLLAWALELGGGGLIRLPVKFWLLVAVGAALLCGIGFERVFPEGRRREAAIALAGLGGLFVVGWVVLSAFAGPVESWLRGWMAPGFPLEFVAHERVRWAGLCLLSAILVGLLAALLRLARRRAWLAGALLLALHLATQLFFLRPLLPTDEAAIYQTPPELLADVPEGARVVSGSTNALFGPQPRARSDYPDERLLWLQRQTHEELHPQALARWHRRAEFAASPEGLDSFLTRATAQAISGLPDAARVALLEAAGVDYLVLKRPLEGVDEERARLVSVRPAAGGDVRVFRLERRVAAARFVGRIERVPHMNAALERLTGGDLDLDTATLLPGEGAGEAGAGGTVELLESGAERLRFRVDAADAGALVVQRSFLPIYRAAVDGAPAAIEVADLHRMAIRVPAGTHEVVLAVDRRPLLLSSVLGVGALIAAVGLAVRRGRAPEAP